jgi:hypothetical protein
MPISAHRFNLIFTYDKLAGFSPIKIAANPGFIEWVVKNYAADSLTVFRMLSAVVSPLIRVAVILA